MNNEVWKQITDYPNYFISNTGKIRNVKTGRELQQYLMNNGYLRISLCKNGKVKGFLAHRLVATAFIPNPDNLDTVDHINGIKTDNRTDNLQWLSHHDNASKFHREQKTEEQKETYKRAREKGVEVCKKPILCLETGKIYKSLSQTSKELNIPTQCICDNLKGRVKQTHGLHFRYLIEDSDYEKQEQ